MIMPASDTGDTYSQTFISFYFFVVLSRKIMTPKNLYHALNPGVLNVFSGPYWIWYWGSE